MNEATLEKIKNYHCPVEASMGVIGGKYKAIILFHLIHGKLRFHEIQKAIPQATAKMLSQQLKDLESDGIVEKISYPVIPPKTEYYLTELGKTLIPIIEMLRNWGEDYFELSGVPNPCKDDIPKA